MSGFADISLLQLLLVAGVALFAAVVGGLAGYGTGALMPLVLVPLIGAEPVVPIIAISSKIGRASCRERVDISGGGASLRTKQGETKGDTATTQRLTRHLPRRLQTCSR